MMEFDQIKAATEAILFASGEPVLVHRIAQVLDVADDAVLRAAEALKTGYAEGGSGLRLVRLENKLQLCSAPEYAETVTRALEQRKPPKLSAAALEVLAIVAYFQPVTRAYIDSVRGVDSAYTVGVLTERGLIEPAGRLEVPGRPLLYKTGDTFLRTMNLASLSELPALPDTETDEGIIALQNKIERLRAGQAEESEGEAPAPQQEKTFAKAGESGENEATEKPGENEGTGKIGGNEATEKPEENEATERSGESEATEKPGGNEGTGKIGGNEGTEKTGENEGTGKTGETGETGEPGKTGKTRKTGETGETGNAGTLETETAEPEP